MSASSYLIKYNAPILMHFKLHKCISATTVLNSSVISEILLLYICAITENHLSACKCVIAGVAGSRTLVLRPHQNSATENELHLQVRKI